MSYSNDFFKKTIKDLLGTNTNVAESKKSKSKREKDEFCRIIKIWDETWKRGNQVFGDTGIDLGNYDSPYYDIIESLFYQIYGEKAEIINWWVYERYTQDGKISTLITEDNEEHILNTPLQLYKFIKKLK